MSGAPNNATKAKGDSKPQHVADDVVDDANNTGDGSVSGMGTSWHENTSSVGGKNVEGVHGRDGADAQRVDGPDSPTNARRTADEAVKHADEVEETDKPKTSEPKTL